MQEITVSKEHLGEAKRALREAHLYSKRVCGLASLLMLQYTHEGHLDEVMTNMLQQEMFDLEEKCGQALQLLTPEKVPF